MERFSHRPAAVVRCGLDHIVLAFGFAVNYCDSMSIVITVKLSWKGELLIWLPGHILWRWYDINYSNWADWLDWEEFWCYYDDDMIKMIWWWRWWFCWCGGGKTVRCSLPIVSAMFTQMEPQTCNYGSYLYLDLERYKKYMDAV